MSPKKKKVKYIIDIPEKAQSINEVVRYSMDYTGIKALKNKWQKIGEHHIKTAIDKGVIPEKFNQQIEVATWIFFNVMRHRDKDNYLILNKALIDALVSLGVVRDDSEEYVDFGGIKFRSDADNPHIKMVITTVPVRHELEIIKKENPIKMALQALKLKDLEDLEEYAPMTSRGIQGDAPGIDVRKIKFALYMAWPSSVRPSYNEIAEEFGMHPRTLMNWIHRPDIKQMILAFTASVAATDVSDVLYAMKERGIAGDAACARLFLQWTADALKATSPVQINNNTVNANVELTPDEVKQILYNLKNVDSPKVQDGQSNSKPRVKERVTTVDKKRPSSGIKDLV